MLTTTRSIALVVSGLFVAGIFAALSTGIDARATTVRPTPVYVEGDPVASTRSLLRSVEVARASLEPLAGVEAAAPPIGRSRDEAASRSGTGRSLLVWPARGAMTGWWHEARRHRLHLGIDIDGETGDPVWSAASGRVVYAGPAPAGYGGFGLMVAVDHGGGQTIYAHLSRIDAVVGQVVAPYTPLGAMGTTGSVTGSHLHFELRINGQPVDPTPYLP